MARLSNADKEKYKALGGEDTCFFCARPAVMWDFTPSPKANPMFADMFEGEKVRVKCCDSCWRKIYTANIAKGGINYGVQRGMMTLEHKKHLLSPKGTVPDLVVEKPPYVIAQDPVMILPTDMLIMDDTKFLWHDKMIYRDEMICLQGAMALRMMGLPHSLMELNLLTGLSSGELDEARIPIYREVLGLEVSDAAPD